MPDLGGGGGGEGRRPGRGAHTLIQLFMVMSYNLSYDFMKFIRYWILLFIH